LIVAHGIWVADRIDIMLDNYGRNDRWGTKAARIVSATAWLRYGSGIVVDSSRIVWDSRNKNSAIGNVFTLAEEREQNERGKDQDLNADGYEESAALVAADAGLLRRISLDKTASQKNIFFRHTWNRVDRHNTPPKFPTSFENFAAPASRVAFGKPAPLSQGCEVRASSAAFDTRESEEVPDNRNLLDPRNA
jgi:hypothetical protein